jgi:kynurenine formamidase
MDPRDHDAATTWGPHDERGMLNAIDASAVLAALRTVRQGRVIALSQTLGPNTPVPAHRPAVARFMNRDCGADKLGPIIGRGVLIDLTLEGSLNAGQAVTAEHLQSAVTTTGIELERGDIVLLYTGWLEQHGGNPDIYFTCEPGLDLTGARWLADHGVAAIGADNVAVEQIPFRDGEVFPVHQLLIRDRGVPLIEGLVLDELARARAKSFLFIALPLKLEGATASPLAPVAVL